MDLASRTFPMPECESIDLVEEPHSGHSNRVSQISVSEIALNG